MLEDLFNIFLIYVVFKPHFGNVGLVFLGVFIRTIVVMPQWSDISVLSGRTDVSSRCWLEIK
jgi:hypothetical protein